MTSYSWKLNRTGVAIAIGAAVALMAPLAQADITGNIGAVSKYVLRGMTNNAENDSTAVQGGLDWSHSSGLYVGYWGSNLDYGNSTPTATFDPATSTVTVGSTGNTRTGFENDIYAGFKLKAGPLGVNLGAIYYAYTQVPDSDGVEALVAASFGPATLAVKYLTQDLAWGNKGDMYWTLDTSHALPSDFTLAGTLGYYVYDKSDPGSTGKIPTGTTKISSGFRHLNLVLSHPVINKTTTMSLTYVIGGKDRTDTKQKDAVVLGLGTTF